MEQFEVGPSFSGVLTAAVRAYKVKNGERLFPEPVHIPLQPLENGTQELVVSSGYASGGIPSVAIEIKTPKLTASYDMSFRKKQESMWFPSRIVAKPTLSMGSDDGGYCCAPEIFRDDGVPFAERLDSAIIEAVVAVYETPIQHAVYFPGKFGPTDRWITHLASQGYSLKESVDYPVFVKVYSPPVAR